MAPDKVNVPLPSFVTVPDVVWIMFATETSPAPPNVIAKVSPEIVAPDNANVPESELILVAAPIVITPAKLLLPPIFLNAPPSVIPVPLIDIGSEL